MSSIDVELGTSPEDGAQTESLYREHSSWLLAFLKRRFGTDAAQDLAQEAFARTAGSPAGIRNPRAFLATLALRAAADAGRRQAARVEFVAAEDADAAVLPEQLEQVLLKQLLRELPQPVLEVYLLQRIAGLTAKEVAQRCGISVKRVEARMTEAHRRFAALLRD